MFRENRLKRKIAAGEAVYGFWLGLGDPALAEMASAAGYDFVIIDNEHGQQTYAQTLDLMRAARAGDATVMVRPSGQHADEIKRLMDMGAEALMVPMIQSAGEAEAMVAAALYPPAGVRGYAAPGVRASGYGMVADYAARANDELFFVAQIETRQASDNVAAIAGVAGVDMLFLGVGDLSATSGFLDALDAPEVLPEIRRFEAAAAAAGVPTGPIYRPGLGADDLLNDGYKLIAGMTDATLFRAGVLADVAQFAAAKKARG
ncbi:MAG: aldolase/citrate lyase family protein [Pseudomonadota bacterium]|nr:aldolase/citrate lyase family protein [Pseudomonadota bacterium]